MTTNHKERLDPALLRPGRADVHVRLDLASEKQLHGLFIRFFPGDLLLADKFAKLLPVGQLSMATLQGHMLLHRLSAQACVDHARDLLTDDSSNVQRGMTVSEWLHRLNLHNLKEKFDEQKLYRVEDLGLLIEEGQIAEHKLDKEDKLISRRLWSMLIGDPETKENFKYLSKHGIRSIA